MSFVPNPRSGWEIWAHCTFSAAIILQFRYWYLWAPYIFGAVLCISGHNSESPLTNPCLGGRSFPPGIWNSEREEYGVYGIGNVGYGHRPFRGTTPHFTNRYGEMGYPLRIRRKIAKIQSFPADRSMPGPYIGVPAPQSFWPWESFPTVDFCLKNALFQ